MEEKKESWIEKLIELLNEFYEKEWHIVRAIWHRDTQRIFELENDDMVWDTAVISKEYWFIKWLVENDKINFSKFNFWNEIMYCVYEYTPEVSEEEELLMLLSINDNPIEFLISILR